MELTINGMDISSFLTNLNKQETQYWIYEPKLVSCTDQEFNKLLSEIWLKCKPNIYTYSGKQVLSARISCIFVTDINEAYNKSKTDSNFNYSTTPSYLWSDAPDKILSIKDQLEKYYNITFDHVLVNIYRSRSDAIGEHNDKEAMNSDIVSVSLGALREFYFININNKNDKHGYILRNGDVVFMKGPNGNQKSCQHIYKHAVPKMNIQNMVTYIKDKNIQIPSGRKTYQILDDIIIQYNIHPIRINLTFRKYE